MNNLAKLLASVGLLLIGISSAVYVFNDIAEKKKAKAEEEQAIEALVELFSDTHSDTQDPLVSYQDFIEGHSINSHPPDKKKSEDEN